jgi:catechol 2,3-dioxygenase-like lactoylglutathione lyase family enzyme
MPLIVLSSFVVVTSAAGQQQQAPETGRMLRPLLITHVVADLNKSMTFYREAMDLAVVSGPAPLADSALVKKLATIRPGATARSATLAIPGSNLQLQLIQFAGIEGKAFTQRLYDPGVTRFSIQVRDIDKAFERVKDRGIVVDTTSAGPVYTQRPRNDTRAVMMRDPDGFVFEFVQAGAPPETDVPSSSNIYNARSSLAIDSFDRSLPFYRDILGFAFANPPADVNDAVLALEGTPRAHARSSSAVPPGSNNMWVLWEFRDIERTRRSPDVQDPGASAIALEVANLPALVTRMKGTGIVVELEPVSLGQGRRVALVRSPDGLLVELVEPRANDTDARAPATARQVAEWMNSISTWGKWGKDDQLGALNYITPATRKAAAALVRTGDVVSLERPIVLEQRHAEIARDGKPNGLPFYEMTFRTFPKADPRGNEDFTSDVQSFAPHGALLTHLDALCHYSNGKGQLYNGYPLTATVSQETGCTRLGLDTLKEGIVTRGVLVDMTKLKARRSSPARVFAEDIEAFEKQSGIRIGAGDALFVYDPQPAGSRGGIDVSVVPWMKERGVALTSGIARVPDDPHGDHRLPLVAAGIFLLDSPDLATLAATAARLNRWEFMLMLAPPRAPGASGYPVNPLAMF